MTERIYFPSPIADAAGRVPSMHRALQKWLARARQLATSRCNYIFLRQMPFFDVYWCSRARKAQQRGSIYEASDVRSCGRGPLGACGVHEAGRGFKPRSVVHAGHIRILLSVCGLRSHHSYEIVTGLPDVQGGSLRSIHHFKRDILCSTRS